METCLYCKNKEKLDSLMLPMAELSVSRLFLFRDQTYRGRCVLAYKEHDVELYQLDEDMAHQYMDDIKRAAYAIQQAVNPAKINYGMFSDTLPHLHVHLVPKQKGGYTFGEPFELTVKESTILSEDEYTEICRSICENL